MKACRSQNDRMIAGVCGGLAEHQGWSPSRLRVVWVLATIFTAFAGVIFHFRLWFLIPKAPLPPPAFDPQKTGGRKVVTGENHLAPSKNAKQIQ
jgi:phage shock protein C